MNLDEKGSFIFEDFLKLLEKRTEARRPQAHNRASGIFREKAYSSITKWCVVFISYSDLPAFREGVCSYYPQLYMRTLGTACCPLLIRKLKIY